MLDEEGQSSYPAPKQVMQSPLHVSGTRRCRPLASRPLGTGSDRVLNLVSGCARAATPREKRSQMAVALRLLMVDGCWLIVECMFLKGCV